MSLNFGTYKGAEILSQAMDSALDRVQKNHQFKQQEDRLNKQLDSNIKFQEAQNIRAQERFDQDKEDWENAKFEKDIANRLFNRSTLPGDYDFYDEDTGAFRPGVGKSYQDLLDATYLTELQKLDPEGKLSLREKQQVATDVQKTIMGDSMSKMIGELSRAGVSQDEIEGKLQEAGLSGIMDDVYRRGFGMNPEDAEDNPLLEAMYSKSASSSDLEDAGISMTSKVQGENNTHRKILEKELLNIKRYSEGTSTFFSDDLDDITITYAGDGKYTLIENDPFNNSEYTVYFDGDKPYIKTAIRGKKVYLSDYQKIKDTLE